MRTAISILTALGLTAVLTAQVNRTAPPGFSTTASPPTATTHSTNLGSYCYLFGAYFDERHQIADGNYKGTAFTITELNLRRDEQVPSSYNTIGKTWTNFALRVGDCDYNKLTTTWTTNFLSTPTTIMTGTLKWPGNAAAISVPETWGDLGNVKGGCVTSGGKTTCTALKFPFAKPYLYTGKQDLLWEFQFFGGTLENQATWGGYNKSYYLDGTSNRATNGGGVSVPVPYSDPIMASCAPPGTTRAAYAFMRIVTYAVHNNPSLPKGSSDSFEISYVVRGAPNLTGVIAISLFGTNDIKNPASIYIGGMNSKGEANIGCMPLGLDLTKPALYHFAKTGTSTGTSYESTRFYVKYNKAYATMPRLNVYGQFAYTHPNTNKFTLTGVGKSLIFEQPVLAPWKSADIPDIGSGNRGPQPRNAYQVTTDNVPLLGYVSK